jgi:hypothetical protein
MPATINIPDNPLSTPNAIAAPSTPILPVASPTDVIDVIRHGQAFASAYDNGRVPASINNPDNLLSTPNDRASCAPGVYNFSFSPDSHDEQEERWLANLPPSSPNLSNEVDKEPSTPSPKHYDVQLLNLGAAQPPATLSPALSRIQQGHMEVTRYWNEEWCSSPIPPSPKHHAVADPRLEGQYDHLAQCMIWFYDDEPISKNCKKRTLHVARRAAAVGKLLFQRKLA